MPKLKEQREGAVHTAPYEHHGVVFGAPDARGNVAAPCPICGREDGKFSVNVNNGKAGCYVCKEGSESGGLNQYWFIRKLHELSRLRGGDCEALAVHRNLLSADTPAAWGCARSIMTNDWLVPAWHPDGRLMQLYTYDTDARAKPVLYPTPTMGTHLFGVNVMDRKARDVYYCESVWNAMALWELLRCARWSDDRTTLEFCGDANASLAADAAVLAGTGTGCIGEPFKRWLPLFAGKRLFLLFDSDHGKRVCKKCRGKPYSTADHPACPKCGTADGAGHDAEPAGLEATKRAVGLLAGADARPAEVHYLHWGDAGYDPELPSGYDVRDVLCKGTTADVAARLPRLAKLLGMLRPIPPEFAGGAGTGKPGAVNPDLLPCETWRDCVNACRKAMKWPAPGEEHDKGLSFMLAVATSTMSVGIQLFGTLISPASSGKTELAMAMAPDRDHVICISDFTGLHSGYKSDKDGAEDHSLMAKVKGKTLIIKEANLLLQKPNLQELLGQLRDAYDTMTDVHYKNGVARNYSGHRFTAILCGTELLKSLDSSDLGERTLCCRIVDDMDPILEREISLRKARQQAREMSIRADGTFESRAGPETTTMQRTVAGYTNYLCENAQRLLGQLEPSPEAEERCVDYAEFVAFMRARPSKRHGEIAEREMSIRLAQQFIRMASCMAVVTNRPSMGDPDVMKRVHGIAIDTGRGRTFEICRRLHVAHGDGGMDGRTVAIQTGKPYKDHGGEMGEYRLLRFLQDIKAVKAYHPEGQPHCTFWMLTARLKRLFDAVVGAVEDGE